MPCTISSGYTIGCLDGIGGIKAVYFQAAAATDMPTDAAFEVDATTNLVDSIAAAGSEITFHKFELKRELSSLEITTNRDGNNGTSFDEQSLTCVFLKPDVNDFDLLVSLADRRNNVLVEDNDGDVYLLGATQGMDVTTGSYQSGTSFGDQKGYTLTLTAREPRTYWCAAIASIVGLTIA